MSEMDAPVPAAFGIRSPAVTAAEFEELVRRHQRRVYRYLLMMVRDPDEADNLTQECFLRAYRNLAAFRGESSAETWLLRIATNLALDRVKDRKASFWRRMLGLDDEENEPIMAAYASPQPSPERQLLAHEEVEAVWKAAESLSQQQRAVFVLRFVEEMELQEIAEVLGLGVASVKTHLLRALRAVRRQLKEVP
jgi:RNA polymerase sigma-70 factor (ECF subfamily)